MGELFNAITGLMAKWVSEKAAYEKSKRKKLITSIFVGLIFFIVNTTTNRIEHNFQIDNLRVLFGLSIFLTLFCDILLRLIKAKK